MKVASTIFFHERKSEELLLGFSIRWSLSLLLPSLTTYILSVSVLIRINQTDRRREFEWGGEDRDGERFELEKELKEGLKYSTAACPMSSFFSQKFRNWGFYFYFKLYAWSKLLIFFKAIALLWTFTAPVSDFYTLIFLSTSSFLMMSDVGVWLWKCSFDSKIRLRWAWLNPLITSIQSVLAASVCYCQSLNVCSVTSYPWEWKEKREREQMRRWWESVRREQD